MEIAYEDLRNSFDDWEKGNSVLKDELLRKNQEIEFLENVNKELRNSIEQNILALAVQQQKSDKIHSVLANVNETVSKTNMIMSQNLVEINENIKDIKGLNKNLGTFIKG